MKTTVRLIAGVLEVTVGCLLLSPVLHAQAAAGTPDPQAVARVIVAEGTVELFIGDSDQPVRVSQGQDLRPGNRLRTGASGRAVVRFSDEETVPMAADSEMRIQAPPGRKRGFEALRGLFNLFHRDRPEDFGVRTRRGGLIIRGTEVLLEVAEGDGPARVSVLDGAVEIVTDRGTTNLMTGEAALLEAGQPPRKTAMLDAVNLVQWRLYYPAVLDPAELGWAQAAPAVLRESLLAYHQGDLLAALDAYPSHRPPSDPLERVYHAALLLSVGQVEAAQQELGDALESAGNDSRISGLAAALQQLVLAVKGRDHRSATPAVTETATAALAHSYGAQSRGDLETALDEARVATRVSPEFGFSWVRLAELEFSFGRILAARRALATGLRLSPRNAQGIALSGFLRAADSETKAAITEFDRAIALDGALGNAWLGRGLCRIRRGDVQGGRGDLLVAASLEPNRSVLRSYLAKAFQQSGEVGRARHELELARFWDANDPTSWLYSALINQTDNRINWAIADLERSQQLNDNRAVYRSRLLLDQDAAVRGANLATVFRDAGLSEVSRREAVRAVNTDYANPSAHLFLADSYNELRDPRQIDLRYDTPWLSEFLIANLLAPAASGTLSPFVTQQEYSRLLERNRLGIVSATDYSSMGDWKQSAVQYGIYEKMSYALEALYRTENGHRPNDDLDQRTTNLRLKFELSPRDSFYLQTTYYRAETGDVAPYYDETQASRGLRTLETQEPLVVAGARHQWAPGIDTLVLAGRLQDQLQVDNPQEGVLEAQRGPTNYIRSAGPFPIQAKYRSELKIETAELQQIVQRAAHTIIAGARFQTGEILADNVHTHIPNAVVTSSSQITDLTQHIRSDFQRVAVYGYYGVQPIESLWLLGGASYDRLTQPRDFRLAPLSAGETDTERVSPKAGLMWSPRPGTTLRAGYTRFLGGVSFEDSFRLEPAQVAGFVQSYRSIIPEAVAGVGANGGSRFEMVGLALDQALPTRTYLGLSAELLKSSVSRTVGIYDQPATNFVWGKGSTPERLDYREPTFTVDVNQLAGDDWSFGARYRIRRANLHTRFPEIPAASFPDGRRNETATLQQLTLFALFNHPSGLFAQAEGVWSAQENDGYNPAEPGDDFWQFNAWAGCRFARRRVEARVGLLNLADRHYRLNPLNLTAELPHERTFVASLRFSF